MSNTKENVHYGDDTHKAREFLEHGIHSHTAEDFFDQAKAKGETRFHDTEGGEYTIKHEEKDGEDHFSVHVHHH